MSKVERWVGENIDVVDFGGAKDFGAVAKTAMSFPTFTDEKTVITNKFVFAGFVIHTAFW